MIESIVVSVIGLAGKIVEAVRTKAGRKPKLDPALEQLESEKIVADMLARARADMQKQKDAKK